MNKKIYKDDLLVYAEIERQIDEWRHWNSQSVLNCHVPTVFDECEEKATYHKNMAAWLKELVGIRSCVRSNAFKDGYNKALEDVCREVYNHYKGHMEYENYKGLKVIERIVEELKGSENNV